ncbi:simple sugar transport system ATP-binding protein [Pararhizobium capsulatum DSM 1112]|uniref:Simple sugar transport system ATP-binding protein n=1 Tax=Pararhizobium capsulatum DSM 1112 TaxID=1121113 RepID=A0ABU0BTX5_9HYPH|nr:sugar ABC transporter ATP-binding protein [Pararhizobium capsulatum]MDQ0321691.1 simple sugar transport system ATP-binding protein [Pararhizobium capsulatum DSM 1112]
MPLLQAQALSRSFGSTRALADFSFSIDPGEIVALMGANGAGKSTFVKIISGVLLAESGSLTFKGQSFAPATPAEATAAGIVTVHQSTDLVGIPGLTVADALLLNRFVDPRQPFFVSRGRIRREAQAMLREAGFDLPVDRDFADLSAAERQLVAIARGLANKAELLILDEPTASLSATESRRLYATLLDLKKRGIAILYISHRTADLEALADRVAVLRGGRLVETFKRPVNFDAAIETMIGRPLASARPDARALTGDPVLELSGIRLLPGSDPFDLTLHRGEVVAITGVLGAGKSRLLSAIFGNGKLAAGEMRLEGRPYVPANPRRAVDAGVAMAGEDRHRSSLMPAGWPGESIAATISLPHLHRWYPGGLIRPRQEREKAEAAINRLGIHASGPNASVWTLSGGNQQKVVLARWEAEPGKLLLLDEPFQGVDVGARHDIITAIRSRSDRATLIATSDPEEAIEVADRVVVMDHQTLLPDRRDAGASHDNRELAR